MIIVIHVYDCCGFIQPQVSELLSPNNYLQVKRHFKRPTSYYSDNFKKVPKTESNFVKIITLNYFNLVENIAVLALFLNNCLNLSN